MDRLVASGLADFMPQSRQQQDFGTSQAAAQNAALQNMGMRQSDGGMDAGMGEANRISAERNMAERAARANQPPASMQDLSNALRSQQSGMPTLQQALQQMGPEERGQYNANVQQAAQDPSTQRQYDAFKSGQGQGMDPNLVRAIEDFRSAAPQQGSLGGQQQMPEPQMPQRPQMLEPPRYTSPPAPNMSQTFPEDPRMQARRMIQQMNSRAGRPYVRSSEYM
jgi:hypothetical protein